MGDNRMLPELDYKEHEFSNDEIRRYSRQLITADYDIDAQEKLKKCSVVIIGCGGLGNPVALYLAGAGIGKIGLVDFDCIEVSNIHRQIGFTMADVGLKKAEVLRKAVIARNPAVDVQVFDTTLTKDNALDIIKGFNVVADCSDNMPTRYILNEACILLKKPLAMGSAVGWFGQFTFYHTVPNGPCYRCLYPNPSGSHLNMSCNEKGIMGPVVGIIGNLQAMEIIKYVGTGKSSFSHNMYNYDGFEGRVINAHLRPRTQNCPSCRGLQQLNDYQMLCDGLAGKMRLTDGVRADDRITVQAFREIVRKDPDAVIVDVRPANEFKIAHIPRSSNVPINSFVLQRTGEAAVMHLCKKNGSATRPCYVICRRGNDSQRVLLLLKAKYQGTNALNVKDVAGGLEAWRREIDVDFPEY